MNILEGVVVSIKTPQAILVEVVRRRPHPMYGKLIRRSRKFKADPNGMTVKVGDRVQISETRPISKGKYFKIHQLLNSKGVTK